MAEDTKKFDELSLDIEQSVVPTEIEGLDDVYQELEHKTNKVWIDGKRVYRQVLDFGALPDAQTKTVDFVDLSNTQLDEIVSVQFLSIQGSATGNDIYEGAYYVDPTNGYKLEWYIERDNPVQAVCKTGAFNYDSWTGRVILEYTRTDR